MAAAVMTALLSSAMAPAGRLPARAPAARVVSRGRPALMGLPNIDGTGAFRDVQVRRTSDSPSFTSRLLP